jgi:hypothetical protein
MGKYIPFYQQALKNFMELDDKSGGLDPNDIIYLVVADAIMRDESVGNR